MIYKFDSILTYQFPAFAIETRITMHILETKPIG